MAVRTQDFPNKIDRGINATSDYKKFLFSLTYNGKRKRKVINFSRKAWNKRDLIKEARKAFIDFEDDVTGDAGLFTGDTKLNIIKEAYFEYEASGSEGYNATRKRNYELYIEPKIGNLAVSRISLNMLNEIKSEMQKQGKTRQTKNGCKAKTINEVIVNTLLPILRYAMHNGAIDKIPPFKKVKSDAIKKEVKNATETLAKLYNAIMVRYVDDPYYRSMFLFALYGRRWNEIATLHTKDISLDAETYTIRAENSKISEDKTFALPQPLIDALKDLNPDTGLVFRKVGKSNTDKIWTPRKQLAKLKEDIGMEELTMHLFRHIVSTALLEMGETSAVAAATLGHKNTATTEKYYATLNNEKSSAKAVEVISEVISEEK